jgi:hypothetical protein
MEYEIYQVMEDGSKVAVTGDKVNDALSPANVVIVVDHTKRKIYNFNGRDSKIRVRFIGARMAAGPIRGELGLTYTVTSIDEGEETNDFRECLRNISTPGSTAVSRILGRPPPPPQPMRQATTTVTESVRRETPGPTQEQTATNPSLVVEHSSSQSAIAVQEDTDISSLVKEFGEIPEGYEIEAVIAKGAVFKNVTVQAKVFGKMMEQTKLERANDIDGLFTLNGEIRVIAKNGAVQGVQVLSKRNLPPARKPKESKTSQ